MDLNGPLIIANSIRAEVAVADVHPNDSQQPSLTTGADPLLSVRPTYRRTASDVETVIASVVRDKTDAPSTLGTSAVGRDHAVSADDEGYPPVLHESATQQPLENLDESKGLRMLRMGASFLTLFLAGWKSVYHPLSCNRSLCRALTHYPVLYLQWWIDRGSYPLHRGSIRHHLCARRHLVCLHVHRLYCCGCGGWDTCAESWIWQCYVHRRHG